MDDAHNCPICNSVLKITNKKDIFLSEIKTWGNFAIKICPGANHFLKIISNDQKEMVWLMCSLNKEYTKFIIINYYQQRCLIICSKNNIRQSIAIDKLLMPDFPHLHLLKKKVDMYVALS
jgi:hypothetical protein